MSDSLDLLVIGSGVAGLSAAVRAAEDAGLRVGVLTKAELHQATTRWAQGGVAAALGGDPDSTDLHLADTLKAGAGLCDVDAVRVLVDEGPVRVTELIALGAMFDRDEHGRFLLAREGGHSLARVVHAGGAATGAEIERALVEAVQSTAAAIYERYFVTGLVVEGGRCVGVRALGPDGRAHEVRARNVLVATGGAGQMFAATTNPVESTGDGIAIALRAGVAVADIEFVQFHPTALQIPQMPRPLLSEALRGHGALLRDSNGERFVDELQPRDVVSRAMTAKMIEQNVDRLWLDATGLEQFDKRFPTINADVRAAGLDPAKDWLPVAPAAHYLCGGIVTDLDGASSLPGLWAAGEVACTGVHGANRLASNSLLEGMVFGPRAVEAIWDGKQEPEATGAMRTVFAVRGAMECEIDGELVPVDFEPGSAPALHGDTAELRARLQRDMSFGAGVLRSADSLAATTATVRSVLASLAHDGRTPAEVELVNIATVALGTLAAATARRESRGAHTRSDFPNTTDAFLLRIVLGLTGTV